jgi:hypothetical protein
MNNIYKKTHKVHSIQRFMRISIRSLRQRSEESCVVCLESLWMEKEMQ